MARPLRAFSMLAGLLASLALFMVLGELLARATGLVDRLNTFQRKLYIASATPDLPYLLRPGVQLRVRDFEVAVNRYGLRSPEVAATPAPGVTRILVLGDSVTFGDGLRAGRAYPALLERILARAAPGRYEVLNAGVPGYNTETELAFLRERGLAFHPGRLVLGVSLNDFDRAPVVNALGVISRDVRQRVAFPWLSNHSEFYLLLRWMVRYARGRLWYQRLAARAAPAGGGTKRESRRPGEETRWQKFDRALARARKQFYHAPRGPGWETLRSSLAALRDLARAHHLPLLVVIFPEADQVEAGSPPDLAPQERWRQLCRTMGLDCLDLYPAFAAARGHRLFFDMMHPNAKGHAIAAREIARRMLARG